MAFGRRLAIVGILSSLFLLVFSVAKHYSPVLITYIVEQTLIEKAPSGTDAGRLRKSFNSALNADENRRLEKLLTLSRRLEKVQRLTPEELRSFMKELSEGSR